jgi:transposase-like protein
MKDITNVLDEKLTKKQKQAIELLTTTDLTYTEVAERLGVHRNTLFRWREQEIFRRELERVLQMRVKFLDDRIRMEQENLFQKALNLIDRAESEHVKADLIKYLMDRGLGKASTKVDITVEPKIEERKEKEEFMQMLEEENPIEPEFEVMT